MSSIEHIRGGRFKRDEDGGLVYFPYGSARRGVRVPAVREGEFFVFANRIWVGFVCALVICAVLSFIYPLWLAAGFMAASLLFFSAASHWKARDLPASPLRFTFDDAMAACPSWVLVTITVLLWLVAFAIAGYMHDFGWYPAGLLVAAGLAFVTATITTWSYARLILRRLHK